MICKLKSVRHRVYHTKMSNVAVQKHEKYFALYNAMPIKSIKTKQEMKKGYSDRTPCKTITSKCYELIREQKKQNEKIIATNLSHSQLLVVRVIFGFRASNYDFL